MILCNANRHYVVQLLLLPIFRLLFRSYCTKHHWIILMFLFIIMFKSMQLTDVVVLSILTFIVFVFTMDYMSFYLSFAFTNATRSVFLMLLNHFISIDLVSFLCCLHLRFLIWHWITMVSRTDFVKYASDTFKTVCLDLSFLNKFTKKMVINEEI